MWRTSEEWERELGAQLRAMRLRLNMSQAEAADRAGVSLGALSRLERGKGSSLSTFVKCAQLMGRGDWLESFSPQVDFSPIQQLDLGHQRQRASKKGSSK